ncbi:MAG: FHA domain-containing protein [Fuerstiella sp.]
MNYSGKIYPEDTVGYFRVASAAGRHPVEPITVGEFLIGSGAQCNLRFGDRDIPEVHTRLHVERDSINLTCAHTRPQLLINGTPTQQCLLADGDMIEIAGHTLLFRLAAAEDRITLDEDSFAFCDEPAADISDMERLLDRIGEQIALVEDLSHTPDDGVVELLKAVAENARASQEAAKASGPSDLQQVTMLLQKHHEASRIRLESLTEVLNSVVQQQKLIADTLEVMSARIQKLDSSTGFAPRRASA